MDFLARYRDAFKPGALVWDVCGVKTAILEAAQVLPGTVDFIGCHPMAGTEFSGVEHALRRCSGTPTSCWCPGMTAGRSTLPCWSGWRPISAARTYAAPPPRPTTP
ncbi:MAG: prephenate dehydrogenase/arogenate dehydrogenase family protein [Flavonifractor plautii]